MSKEESSKAKHSPDESGNALAARRARLRSSLTTAAVSASPNTATGTEPETVNSAAHTTTGGSGLPITEQNDSQALELLGNIDQALSSCATHLASLQKVAAKQIDELKIIADTLQHKSVPEGGLNINTLMESLTAAIEPMKAIGELVPALDRLVSVSTLKTEAAPPNQLTQKQLILSLAEQLAAGTIDATTFKSAYQAVFPDYDLNGLLHHLSELLGEQQLSGDLFQTAFSALQAGGLAPAPAPNSNWAEENVNSMGTMQPALAPTPALFSERETELEHQLADKEKEFAEYKEHLDQRWQELSAAYEELRTTLQSRDNILEDKENELSEKIAELSNKDSENQQLRAQMEELRDQTKEMVADLQKQLAQKHAEEKAIRTAAKTKAAAPQPGFFELFTPSQTAVENEPDSASNTVPSAPSLPVQAAPSPRPVSAPQQSLANMASNNQEGSLPNSPANQPVVSQPGFASPAASFVSAAGSYGSGVRAQVFEVIVRQALAGAHWREICAVPMQINNISPEEVESEVKRRQALLKK